MAKSHALTRFAPRHAAPVVVVSAPRRGRVRRLAARAAPHVRRGARAGARALPVIGLALGGAAVGYAEQKGYLNKLPSVGGSRALPIAGVGWALTRFSKNQTIRMAGVAMIVAGAFDWGRVQGGGVHGFASPEDGGAGRGGGF